MAREIAEGKGIIVFRENAKDLIDIRKGKVDLKSIVNKVEKDIIEIDELFKNSSLPDNIDPELINNLLIKIRKKNI